MTMVFSEKTKFCTWWLHQ